VAHSSGLSAGYVFEAVGKARAICEVLSFVLLIHFLLVQKTNQKGHFLLGISTV
jgi:hypothetical protein